MGKWGEKSSWAKANFTPKDGDYVGSHKQQPKRDRSGSITDSATVEFVCKRCGVSVLCPRVAATGRADVTVLMRHLESGECCGEALSFNDAVDGKQAADSIITERERAEDIEAITRLVGSASPSPIILVGLVNPKTPNNMGSVLRAMSVYHDGFAVLYSGSRYDKAVKFQTDPHDAGSTIPKIHIHSWDTVLTALAKKDNDRQCSTVAVDMIQGACSLHAFTHPDERSGDLPRALLYLFGPEDGSISADVLAKCDEAIFIPTKGSMNLAATVNVLMYDRQAKRLVRAPALLEEYCLDADKNRNGNNRLALVSQPAKSGEDASRQAM